MVRYTTTRLLVAGSSFFISLCFYFSRLLFIGKSFFVVKAKQLYIREIKIVFYGTVKVDG